MKHNGPWRVLNSKIKYTNPWLKLREDQVVRPDGKESVVGVVQALDGIAVLPIDDDGFVYLIQEYRYGIERNSIEAVTGGIDEGESPENAAKRALNAQLGVTADDWTYMGLVDPLTSAVVAPQRIYVARRLHHADHPTPTAESSKMLKMKLDEAVNQVETSDITHAPTAVLILKLTFLRAAR